MDREESSRQRELWAERIAVWQRSGMSQAAFCKAHQFSYSTFNYWVLCARRGTLTLPTLSVHSVAPALLHNTVPALIPVHIQRPPSPQCAPIAAETPAALRPRASTPPCDDVVLRFQYAGARLELTMLPTPLWCAELLQALS